MTKRIIGFLVPVALMALFSTKPVVAAGGPSITSLNFTSGPVGLSEWIYGSGFGSSQGSSTVTFNGTLATTVQSWGSNGVSVIVPAGATTGNVVVTVKGKASNGVLYTVVPPPVINSISPTSGPVGTTVYVSGTNFGSKQWEMDMVGIDNSVAITSWSDTSIVATIPDLSSGNLQVNVGGVLSNGVYFTIPPSISSLSPAWGPAGASVTISGSNFGASQGSGTVTFNGAPASVTSWANTSIVAAVPTGATTGNVVVTAGGYASNGVNFVIGTISTPVYHLDQEAGWLTGTELLSATGPDSSTISIQSPNLNSTANGTSVAVQAFSTQPVVPGYIPAGTNVTFSLWMNESTVVPGLYPYATVAWLDSSGNIHALCSGTGSTALTTSLSELQVICTISSAITLDDTTRLYTQVSVINNSGGSISSSVTAGLEIGGILNGDYDSQVTIPEILSPFISSLSPTSGSEGANVTVSGGGFGSSQGSSTVTFNGLSSNPSAWSDTSITVPVPNGATSGPAVVKIGEQATNSVNFTVVPTVSAISPTIGPVGTTVTISGASFGATQGSSYVNFNGQRANPTSWSDTSIVASVPAYATTGSVSVNVSGNVATSPTSFTVTPVITAIAPPSAPAGSNVYISGYDFGISPGTVTFNGIPAATVGVWQQTSLVATVPSGASSGPVVVTAAGAPSNPYNFAVTPSITSISPVSGSAGTVVTISGLSFGASQGSALVLFNGVAATPTSWSNTSITVPAPPGVSTGLVTIVSGGASSNGVTFAATPSIQALSPNSGTAGAAITITGSGFGPTQGSSSVEFAGTLASPTGWSSTKIVVPVPSGATSGQVVVAVNGAQSNGVNFTVGSGGFNGVVSDSSSGNPIVSATIEVLQAKKAVANATTASDGSYSITSLQPGTYDLSASASGYGTGLNTSQSVSANSATTVNFSLSVPGTISGKVTQSDGVTGISGATVTAAIGGDVLGTASTDSSGNYTVGSLSAGTYSATAANPGYVSQTQDSLAVSSGGSTPANFTLAGESVITYTYDTHGRLVGASDSLGNTAVYQYDAVGNLLSISQGSSSQTSIIEFSPTSGPIGTTVTISGTAFSTNPSQDSVSFNGTTAVVTSASSTQLVATVPSGATTGTISVTAPSGTATSAQSFTVTSGSNQPTIASFTPTSGVAGTPVTITGTGFDTNLANDRVDLNLSSADVTSATGTTITASVPGAVSSGHFSVQTKNGKAISTQDFYVPFGGYGASSIGYEARIAENTNQNVSIGTTGDIGLLLFDGVAGQEISIATSGGSFSRCNLDLIDPYGKVIGSTPCYGGSANYVSTLTLAYSGTYTIGIDPENYTGSVNVALNAFSPVTGVLQFDSPTGINIPYTGQQAIYTFGGTAGQVIDLAFTGESFYGGHGCWNYSIINPDGSTLVNTNPCENSANTGNLTLPSTGTYTIYINPGPHSGGVTATLTQLSTQSLAFDSPLTVSSNYAGQDYEMTFSGTSSQVIDLAFTGESFYGGHGCWNYSIINPDGSTLVNTNPCENSANTGNLTLTQTGTYTIYINPGPLSGGVTATLTQLSTQTLAFDSPLTVSSNYAGQDYEMTFSGTASQVIDLAFNGESFYGGHGCWNFAIINPDGSTLVNTSPCENSANTGNVTLPDTGTYSIYINPGPLSGGVTATLTQLSIQTLAFNSPLTVSSNYAGQDYEMTFNGTASQVIDLAFTGESFYNGGNGCWNYSIINPDGSTLVNTSPCATSTNTGNLTLPDTGTYSIYINPGPLSGGVTADLTLVQ